MLIWLILAPILFKSIHRYVIIVTDYTVLVCASCVYKYMAAGVTVVQMKSSHHHDRLLGSRTRGAPRKLVAQLGGGADVRWWTRG